MKKFEEEFDKNVTSVALRQDGESVITVCDYKEAKAFGQGWHSDEEFQLLLRDRDTLKQGNDNLFKNHLELVEENDELKSQLEKQQPEIPEFVAKAVMEINLGYLFNGFTNGINKKAKEWLEKHKGAKPLGYYVCQLRFQGFTVAKEKQFYLKDNRELESVGNTCIGYVTLYLKNDGYLTTDKTRAGKFTQQEIDSMETGSYEQIEVEE